LLPLCSESLVFRLLKIKDKYIYIIIILSVVLYGCETLSLTLREENRLKVSENKALREWLEAEEG
jgi:hypothetical protein